MRGDSGSSRGSRPDPRGAGQQNSGLPASFGTSGTESTTFTVSTAVLAPASP
ncbi:hypothetical protein [Nonomuraea rubra]|uniref:hypothetical protein n=1 Tax=Nonomuraea rubra TaxID=46180 RepID=UPI0031E90575